MFLSMNSEILFQEKQRLNYWWLWLLMLGVNALSISAVYFQYTEAKATFCFYDMLTPIIPLGLTLFLYLIRLETEIKTEGIYVRFFPLHLKFKFFAWSDIKKSNVRKYNPLGEYFGWGIKGTRKNLAYNVSGNIGLQLEFTDGKRLLIGTRKEEEMKDVLRELDLKDNNNN